MLADAIERFDAIASEWIDDATEAKPSSVPAVLYHYTDAAGLHGMLTNDKVWLTDFRFLNDKTEIIHTSNVAKEVVKARLGGSSADAIETLLYGKILERLEAESKYPFLVFSLSEAGDDLSQWRGYAKDGLGFAIGFDGLVLQKASAGPKGRYQFSKVEYDHPKQTKALEQALSDLEDELRKQAADPAMDQDELAHETARSFQWMVHNRGSVNKHSSFKSEKEWRILEYIGKVGLSLKVRASGNRLIPYAELCPCPTSGKLPIKRIGIGPRLSGSIDIHAVDALCKQTGYKPEIYLASAPYRSF